MFCYCCCWFSCYSVVIPSLWIPEFKKKKDSPTLKNNPFYTQNPNRTKLTEKKKDT